MRNSGKIFYLAAGSCRWGAGHLRRSYELIKTLRNSGATLQTVAFIPYNKEKESFSSLIESYDRCVHTLDEIGIVKADGIVVDVNTDFQPELFLWLKKQKIEVIALDWYQRSDGLAISTVNLRGGTLALEHCIIREEFLEAFNSRDVSAAKYDAVVVLGGGDLRGYINTISGFFEEDQTFLNRKIAIVIGPIVNERDLRLPESSSSSIKIFKNPDNIADIMAKASVGITNGGTTLMEFTMLGVPTIIFPQSYQEDKFVKSFIKNGCGILGSLEQIKFIEQLQELWENEMLWKERSQKARSLIDGRGVNRIANVIANILFRQGCDKT